MQLTDDLWIQDINIAIERSLLFTNLDLSQYGLFGNSFNTKDVFDIFTHHVLKDICQDIIAALTLGTATYLYKDTSYSVRESGSLPFTPDMVRAVSRLEKLIPRVIPAQLITKPYDVREFYKRFHQRAADAVEVIERLNAKRYRNAFKPFNLNKIIDYLDKRGLKYLSTDYFQQENSKLLAGNK
jgi:hypothetical protein